MSSSSVSFTEFTEEEMYEVFPPGLENAVTLWIRAGMPRSNAQVKDIALHQPPVGDHSRAGWFMCLVLMIESWSAMAGRERSAKIKSLETRLGMYRENFRLCMKAPAGSRVDVVYEKDGGSKKISIPQKLVTVQLKSWMKAAWPSAGINAKAGASGEQLKATQDQSTTDEKETSSPVSSQLVVQSQRTIQRLQSSSFRKGRGSGKSPKSRSVAQPTSSLLRSIAESERLASQGGHESGGSEGNEEEEQRSSSKRNIQHIVDEDEDANMEDVEEDDGRHVDKARRGLGEDY